MKITKFVTNNTNMVYKACYTSFTVFTFSALYSIIPDAIITIDTVIISIDAIEVIVGSISERTPSHIIFGSVAFLKTHLISICKKKNRHRKHKALCLFV